VFLRTPAIRERTGERFPRTTQISAERAERRDFVPRGGEGGVAASPQGVLIEKRDQIQKG